MRHIGQRNGLSCQALRRRHRELRLEPLESRTLLSATPTDDSFHLVLYAESSEIEIPAEVGVQSDDSTEALFTVDDSGEIYMDATSDLTLGDFFDIWQSNAGVAGNEADAVLSEDQLMSYVEDSENTVQMFVNGEVSTDFDDHVVQDGDEIVVVYGDNPVLSLNTNFGPIVIELYADDTPITVDNFLNYVNDGDYLNSIIHRSVEDFVIQGGGYTTSSTTFTSVSQFDEVPEDAPITNEPGISNLRGALAMAKLSGNPDSATSQFYVNLGDNSFLDNEQYGAFTVFGQILDMTTVDEIASLTINTSNASPFAELPLGPNDELVVVESTAGQGEIYGVKYVDANGNNAYEDGETLLAGHTVFLDANENGALDSGETSTVTGEDGSYSFQVEAGAYVVCAEVTSGSVATEPVGSGGYTVTVEIGREASGYDFGEVELSVPTSVDLLAASDTGSADDDNLTRLNNADSASTLQFLVSGVTDGAEVQILADGVVIGSEVASGDTVTVTTDGAQALADGAVSITAVQVFGGTTDPSDPLEITIDATAPEALTNQAPELARVGEAYAFDADSPEEGSVVYSLENAPDGMTIDAATGEVSWTPSTDQAVPQSFLIVQTDGAGNATSESVSLTVLGAIQAYPDDYSVDEDTSLTVAVENGVLANDDTTQGTLASAIVDQPTHGAVTLNSDGSLEYTPDEDFCGTDTFTYQATNGGGDESNVALVTIFVNAVNDAPVAVEDSYVGSEGAALIVTTDEGALANDSDVDGDALTAELVDDPSHGELTLYSDGSFSYVPEDGFYGEDSFTYKANDGTTDSETVSVLITVSENVIDLGTVDFLLLSQLDLTEGTLTYSLQTAHDGYLTFEALFSDAGSATMTLLDADGNELAVSSAADGGQRIDWETLAEVDYALKLSGDLSAVDLRIANLVHHDGTTVTVYGTSEADTFLFSAETGRNVTINDVLYAFGNDEVSEVVFDADKTDADAGSDVVWIEGSDLAETLTATFEGEDLVPTVVFATNDGAAQPFAVTAVNFEQLLAWSRSGEADAAVFEDSPGQDKAKAMPGDDAALIRNTSGYATFYRRAKLFEKVAFVGANSPDNDTVVFFDTDGSDLFEANGETGEHALTAESGQVSTASGFSQLLVRSIYDGDTDTATFVDSIRNDKFVARPAKARLSSLVEGYEYDVIVRDFDVAEVDFSNGGNDVARLTDSARADQFVGTPTECTFTAASYTFTVKQADKVTVTSLNAGDGDTAEIHDTDGDDVLQAGYDDENAPTAELWTPDKDGDLLFQLVGVESVDAYGTTGTNRAHIAGTDFVQLHGLWGENSVPEAQDDAYEVDEDGELTIDAAQGVLANDSDTDGDSLTAALVASPAHGAVTLNDDGSFTYTPEADFWGSDTFTYLANDGFGDSAEATVTITVNPVNDGAPVAAEDSYSVSADTSLTVDAAAGLLANDTDVDGDALSATLASSPANGNVSLNTDGSFTYTPDAGFHGADSFTYIANDGAEGSAVTTVTIDVNSPAAPVEDAYSVDEDDVLAVDAASGVLANDIDADGDSMTATLVAVPSHGVLTFDGDGSFSYTPNEDFWGSDTFTYTVDDGYAVSAEATVLITVAPVNDAAPTVADDVYEVAVNGNLNVDAASGVLANDTDADGDTMTAAVVASPSNGTLTLNADGSFTYAADADFHGTDSFTYAANDGAADSTEATVTIAVNTAPDPVGDSYSAVEDQVLTIDAASGLLANDSDPDSDSLTATLLSTPSHGTATVNADGSFTYTPNAGYEGEDSFTYVVNDGFVDSMETSVTITVTPANDAPVAVEDAYSVPVNATLSVNSASGVLANDSDANGDSLNADIVAQPSNGTLTLNADGSFAYTPNADFHGTDTFTYAAGDGASDSAETTVTLNVNTAASPSEDAYSVDEDGSLTVDAAGGVLSNDNDADGDSLSAALNSDVSHGTLSLEADGSFTYTPDADFSGTDEFTYMADDGFGNSVETTVTITVNAVNDLPATATDAYTVDENNVLTVDAAAGVLANDGDVDGDSLSAVLMSAPAHGTLSLNSDGSFTFTPMDDYSGTDTFTYVASDGSGNSLETTVTIEVLEQ